MKKSWAVMAGTAVFALACTLGPGSVRAQEPRSAEQERLIAEQCAKDKCQRNVQVVLRKKEGGALAQQWDFAPPIVSSMGLMVMAGQTIHVEADMADGKLVNLVAVDTVTQPQKTITAVFMQKEDASMVLVINNPFSKALKFNMGIQPMGKEELYKTSSCPIMPGIKLFEMWPYPIWQVILARGQFLERGPNDPMVCVE